ncbi:hypothetical protein JNK13_01875 [bacterium]|nr:hypothetical protein [bacterium]
MKRSIKLEIAAAVVLFLGFATTVVAHHYHAPYAIQQACGKFALLCMISAGILFGIFAEKFRIAED